MHVLTVCEPTREVSSPWKIGPMNVALTLVEAAAQHDAPHPEGTRCPLYITGHCSWLPQDSWVLRLASAFLDCAIDIAVDPDIESAGSVRRKVIAVALLR